MDVDSELDEAFMSKFSSLGTTDRDVLVNELQRLLDFQLNHAGCIFFLDMTNWNLQVKFATEYRPYSINRECSAKLAAIGAYYDFNGYQSEKLPSMEFVQDITIGEGEAIPAQTKFLKTWRLKNNGTERWPPGVFLKFTYGDQLGPLTMVLVDPLCPMTCTDVSVQMISPSKNGIYQGQWRMCTPTGQYFGDIIWVIIGVKEDGLLGVTQQLSELGHETRLSPVKPAEDKTGEANPFCSPPVPPVPFNSPIRTGEQPHRTTRRAEIQMAEKDDHLTTQSREQ